MKILHHLTGFSRRSFLAAFMAFVMAACLCLPTGDAFAADRPKWLGIKMKTWKIVRNNKVKNINHPGYYSVYLEVVHTNNSKDKVVTALYDKKGRLNISASATKFSVGFTSTQVTRVTLDPGQSTTVKYGPFPIAKATNQWAAANGVLKTNKRRIDKWTYDCKVKSQGL